MLNPKIANPLVSIGQSESIGSFWMRKTSRIKIQTKSAFLRPRNPVGEMFRFNRVAVHFPAAKLAIERVQVQTMFAGNERQRFVEVGAKFFRRARLAGIISRDREAVAERATDIFKTAHVVALPAVQRDGNLRKGF